MASSQSRGMEVVVRVGVVGAGVIARRLAPSFAQLAASRASRSSGSRRWCTPALTAVCDLHEPAARAFAQRYSTPQRTVKVCVDYEGICAAEDVDLIYVAVPPSLHASVVLRALASGKHVLCEKPLALTNDETTAMVEAARSSGKVCAVNLPFRYGKTMRKFREMLEEGYVGHPRRVQLTFRFPQWPRSWQKSAWVAGSAEGGPLREVGTHFLFALLELFPSDPPKRVRAQIHFPGGGKCEDSGWGVIELESGLACAVDLLCGAAAPEENSITVLGDKGMLSHVDWCYLKGRSMKQALKNDSSLTTYATDEDVDCSEEVVLDVMKAIASGPDNSNIVTFETASTANRILNALYTSQGEWITLS